jgi:hypothetical protein
VTRLAVCGGSRERTQRQAAATKAMFWVVEGSRRRDIGKGYLAL